MRVFTVIGHILGYSRFGSNGKTEVFSNTGGRARKGQTKVTQTVLFTDWAQQYKGFFCAQSRADIYRNIWKLSDETRYRRPFLSVLETFIELFLTTRLTTLGF